METVRVREDERLTARILKSVALYYDDEGDLDERPDHVRAGSSLAKVLDKIILVQDDVNFLALIDRKSYRVTSLPLPKDPEGDRVFDKDHSNEDHKFDLEACVAVPGADTLLAFGSGASKHREWIVTIKPQDEESERHLYDAAAFYAFLRDTHDFSGSGLNLEGAIFIADDTIRLFQRGDAEPEGKLQAVDATADLLWSELKAHLENPASAPPALDHIVQYDLGELNGVRLTFSDAEWVGQEKAALFSASAEAPSDTKDGKIKGSVLGVIGRKGARRAKLLTETGEPFGGKVEGLTLDPDDPYHVYFVTDEDDKEKASSLCEVRLEGPWYEEA